MTFSANSIAFIGSVFFIAVVCWFVRLVIESNPEPFILGLSFFAFAGQFIRTAEWTSQVIVRGQQPGYGTVVVLLIFGLCTFAGQAFVMKTHMQITKDYYAELLRDHSRYSRNHQIDRWATVLLRVTDTDFFPGGYRLLKDLFPTKTEPREKSRELAVHVLPKREFRIGEGQITPELLVVPATRRSRRFYWWSYVALCVFSWTWFVWVMMIPRERF